MKLSTRGRYGLRLMLDIACHYKKGPVLLKDISKRQEISEKYLWQLIDPIKKAGLIKSTRGAKGGYTLEKDPREITLKDILLILEGPMGLVECVESPRYCKRSEACVSREVWCDVSHKILEILESYTLKDMVEKENSKSDVISYAI